MDDLIEKILAEMQDPQQEQFTDLDDQVPAPVRPAEGWVEILNNNKEEFEVDGAIAVFSAWRVEDEDPLDVGDIEIAHGIHVEPPRTLA